mmetsp:Transcript_5700/g.10872  ORF Transcript_5700/g.10872 Transcript_5700/m.10872 type:complete len:547 (-) Transcript_5700:108-1748(-)
MKSLFTARAAVSRCGGRLTLHTRWFSSCRVDAFGRTAFHKRSIGAFLGAAAMGGVFGVSVAACSPKKKDWPTLSRTDIESHDNDSDGVWIVVGNEVFDLTEFVDGHPGGRDKIMLAAGKCVDPFWNVYRQHLTEKVRDILRPYKIGVIDSAEWAATKIADANDPYSTDPDRNPILQFHSKTPCNAEPPPQLVADSYLTPNELFFIRNHSPVPVIDVANYKLTIKGRKGQEDRNFTLEQLKSGFKRVEMTSSIQCGGNRRQGLNEIAGKPVCSGTEWSTGAISTAKWAGVSLREILDFCGHSQAYCSDQKFEHMVFEGYDGVQASIPIEKALNAGDTVLLAYEMNGEPLPADHGFPVRVVVAGHVGIRNIKWLKKIHPDVEEAHGPWQRGIAYKGFNPSTTSTAGIDVESLVSLQEMPVQSAIVSPISGQVVEVYDGKAIVRGYAWSGGGRGIIRVDVSADGGETWEVAELGEGKEQPLNQAWAWTLWECEVPVSKHVRTGSQLDIFCRATDASYNVQPESVKSIWNLRGIVNNSIHRVRVKARIED